MFRDLQTADTCRQSHRSGKRAYSLILSLQPGSWPELIILKVPVSKPETVFIRILKPALMTVSMAAAIFFGIMLGNLSQPVTDRVKIPVELALIDDAAIESVNILLNE